jgi:DNA-formamidopyrimidine glycosylase
VPELPEVEVVRRGLDRWVSGRTVTEVEVLHSRATRRHRAGPADFADRLTGRRFGPARRRGKYLWLPLDGTGTSLLGHLGMSGQLLVQPQDAPDEKHLRIRICLDDTRTPGLGAAGGTELRFVDQRTFGGLSLHGQVPGSRTPSRTSRVTRLTPDSTRTPSTPRCAAAVRPSNAPCSTSRSSAGSATSTPTRRCGGPGSTTTVRPPP